MTLSTPYRAGVREFISDEVAVKRSVSVPPGVLLRTSVMMFVTPVALSTLAYVSMCQSPPFIKMTFGDPVAVAKEAMSAYPDDGEAVSVVSADDVADSRSVLYVAISEAVLSR